MQNDRFGHSVYTIRRKILTIAGAKFHVFDEHGQVVFFSKQKAFKLKEDIRVYASEAMDEELLRFSARSVIDFGVTFDVVDVAAGETLGSVRRKGMKSLIRDEWIVFGPDDAEIAKVREDSGALAILRRLHELFSVIVPQSHVVEVGGLPVAQLSQNRNPFVQRTTLAMVEGASSELDPRMAVAVGVLIAAIEGRQG